MKRVTALEYIKEQQRGTTKGGKEVAEQRKQTYKERDAKIMELQQKGKLVGIIAEEMNMKESTVRNIILRETVRSREIEKERQLERLKAERKPPELPKVEYQGKVYRDVFYQIAGW